LLALHRESCQDVAGWTRQNQAGEIDSDTLCDLCALWRPCFGGGERWMISMTGLAVSAGIRRRSWVLFRNAYTAASSCNPSRTAIFSGRPPHRSGLYHNQQKMREVMPEVDLLPRYFSKQGYWSAGSGDVALHHRSAVVG
jgi:Sulfatase